MGLCLPQSNSVWPLDTSREPATYQLEGVDGCVPRPKVFPAPLQPACSHTNGQHHVVGIHTKTGWNPLIRPDDTSNHSMEMVFGEGAHSIRQAHPRITQPSGRRAISPNLLQEPMADPRKSVQVHPENLGSASRRGFVRRPHDKPVFKVRLLAERPRRVAGRRLLPRVVAIPYALDKPSVEPSNALCREDSSRATTPTLNFDYTSVAERSLVPHCPSNGNQQQQPNSSPGGCDPVEAPSDPMPPDPDQVTALRLDALRSSGIDPGLSEISQALLRQPRLCDSVTNRSYRRGQELFVLWALQHNVSITDFSPVDLTNFLSHLYTSHNFMLGTLRLARAAVTHLHRSPDLIRQQSDNPVSALLDALAAQAPPRPQYKPEVNLSKTLKYLTNIPSSRSTPLNTLQKKVAFLLGMAAFLRPSDLHRIDLRACTVFSSGILSLSIVSPKEKRKKQRIIKTLTVHPHAHNSSMSCRCVYRPT
ncbi:hypothetical protein G6F43_011687 [Rhizopus delemar]|nr:hypothetical protein G6F43_011687 [Rhizopus delemar]